MQSKADKRDTQFLTMLKKNFEVSVMNETSVDFKKVICSLNTTEKTKDNAPDYQFDNGYIEKFDLSASKREKIGEKFQYTKYVTEHRMKKQIKKDEKNQIYKTNYYAGDYLPIESRERASISCLHENLFSLIEQKTKRSGRYITTSKSSRTKGLLVNLDYNIDVFKNQDNEYVNKMVSDTNQLVKEEYQLWKDLTIIKRIQKEYSHIWDVFLFVRKQGRVFLIEDEWVQEEKYQVYAFDLREPLQEDKLIKYPNPILHTQEDYARVTIWGNRRN